MTDLERLARVLRNELAECVALELPNGLVMVDGRYDMKGLVRALLLELRNPSEGMVEGVRARLSGYPSERQVSAYLGAVVDHILGEDQG